MSRHRTDPHGNYLPPRLAYHHGAYYYRIWNGQAHRLERRRLSKTYSEAIRRWAEIEGSDEPGRLVKHAIERYLRDVLPEKRSKTLHEYQRMSTP